MMEKEWLVGNPHLHAEESSPIERRIAPERKEMLSALMRLRDILGAPRYDAHIAPVQNIAKSGSVLLVTVRSAAARTMLLKECAATLKSVFSADVLKVIAV